MEFITRSTKIRAIIASVLTGIALITLIMLSCLLSITDTSKTLMSFIYTVSLMLVLLFWVGGIQIRVFNDYRCQKKHLCVDGVLTLCLGALITISAILFGVLQASSAMNGKITETADIRVFLSIFVGAIALWKIATTIMSYKERRYNWWCELLFAIFWFALTVLLIVSMSLSNRGVEIVAWIFMAFSCLIIALDIFYILFSYVFRNPTYLETEKAIEKLKREEEEKEVRRKNQFMSTTNSTKDKLDNLIQLKLAGYITEREYNARKKEILDKDL